MKSLNTKAASVKPSKKAEKTHKKTLAGSQGLSIGDVVAQGGEKDNDAPKERRQVSLRCCPFCGAAAGVEVRITIFGESLHSVGCLLCGVKTPAYVKELTAVAVWNRRVTS